MKTAVGAARDLTASGMTGSPWMRFLRDD
jgi:hypothetical protein